MNQNPEEEEWIDTMTASKRFNVSPAWLYKLAFEEPQQLTHRIVTKGRLRSKIEYSVSDLKRWDAKRDSRFKKTSQPTEQPGRMRPAPAGA